MIGETCSAQPLRHAQNDGWLAQRRVEATRDRCPNEEIPRLRSIRRAGQSGFTLLEILIALAVAGLLLALALPAYDRHLLRSGRLEANRELMETAADQERYRARNGSFITDALPLWAPATEGRRRVTRGGHYEIEVRACPNRGLSRCFIATARPIGRQSRDDCGSLTLSSDGLRGAAGPAAANCWP